MNVVIFCRDQQILICHECGYQKIFNEDCEVAIAALLRQIEKDVEYRIYCDTHKQ